VSGVVTGNLSETEVGDTLSKADAIDVIIRELERAFTEMPDPPATVAVADHYVAKLSYAVMGTVAFHGE